MDRSGIKNLRPSKDSRYKQGYIDPKTCKKIFESEKLKPIIYRSSYERKFINWLELNKNIKEWCSEPFYIEYEFRGKKHKYYPDFLIKDSNNNILIIEIKPQVYSKQESSNNRYVNYERLKNYYKWQTTKEWCKEKGYQFLVITEDFLSKI